MVREKQAARTTAAGQCLLAVLVLLLTAHAAAASAAQPPLEGAFGESFTVLDEPAPAPDVAFARLDGGEATLADYRGRVVVLNFWATWCAPCRREMPSLDALAGELGGEGLTVLGVSEDRGGAERVRPFLDRLGLSHMEIALDPRGKLAAALGITGLPATYLLNARGEIVGHLQGPAEWDAEPAKALVRYYLDRAETSPAGGLRGEIEALWQRLRAFWAGE